MNIEKINGFIINYFTENLSKIENFPNIIQGIGLALLTILIPLAIAVLTDLYQKRKDKDDEFVHLDLNVILDSIFNIRWLIFSVLLVFIPLLFWNIFSGLWKLVLICLPSIGIASITLIIINVYRWIKGNVFKYRFSYLRKVKKDNDLEITWKSVWKAQGIENEHEKEFLKIFFKKMDCLFSSYENSLQIISALLSDFYNSIENRLIYRLSASTCLKHILECHFKSWQYNYLFINDHLRKKENIIYYQKILRLLDAVLGNIISRSAKEGALSSFIEYFEKHAEKFKSEVIGNGNKHEYIKYLFRQFYNSFFTSIETVSTDIKYEIWEHYFPKRWKITKSNLEERDSGLYSKLSFVFFYRWAVKRIRESSEREDLFLGELTNDLFPRIDSNLFLKILMILTSGSNKKRNVKNIIENTYNFGEHMPRNGRVLAAYKNKKERKIKKNKNIKKRETETYELLYSIFNLFFVEPISKENLKEYIEELKSLKYSNNSKEEIERIELLEEFEKMINHLDYVLRDGCSCSVNK